MTAVVVGVALMFGVVAVVAGYAASQARKNGRLLLLAFSVFGSLLVAGVVAGSGVVLLSDNLVLSFVRGLA